MQITLMIEGKEKTFESGFIPARMVRETISVAKGMNLNNLEPEELDRLVGFIVKVFGKQFTIDDVYDGLEAKHLMKEIERCLTEVVGTLEPARKKTEGNGNPGEV